MKSPLTKNVPAWTDHKEDYLIIGPKYATMRNVLSDDRKSIRGTSPCQHHATLKRRNNRIMHEKSW